MSSSSNSRSPKRRRVDDGGFDDNNAAAVATATTATRPSTSTTTMQVQRPLEAMYQTHVQTELQDIKTALDHERSMRSLDQRRHQQNEQRLQRQIQFLTEELQSSKVLLDEVRETSETHIAQLRQSKKDALRQLRQCQQDQLANANDNVRLRDDTDVRLAKEKVGVLQEKLRNMTEENDNLRRQLAEVTQTKLLSSAASEKEKSSFDNTKESDDDDGSGTVGQHYISPAPTEVLRELNKVRIALAESERKHRQLRRKAEDWQQRANMYVVEREAHRSATARVRQVEQELRDLRRRHETMRAANESWDDLARQLGAALEEPTIVATATTKNNDGGTPPEIVTVMRHLEKTKLRTQQLADDKASLQKSLDTSNERVIALESLRADADVIVTKLRAEMTDVQSQLDSANRQIQCLRVQEGIWKREADGLRSLLKTFDDLPGGGTKKTATPTSSSSSFETTGAATTRSLQVSLEASQEEIRVLTEERNRLTKEMEVLREQQTTKQKEHDRVVEKFGKLRDALTVERKKVEDAERRASEAEALAGKGSFNTDETRVVHLQKNPLTEAIRNKYESEIRTLQRLLEDATGQKPSRGVTVTSTSEVDPQKLHQRLKQAFQEQIALFREGVYLMTGWKVDMVPGPTGENPRFRARSLFAEQEQDHLMMVCNKSGDELCSLDLAETQFAKVLTTTDSYQYMTKFDSIPAFMASVQLSLFEKQTMIVS